ncbi:ankyrin repeat domain-containing protein [Microbacterium sp. LRZ72]|uniref:ankyrin repeat domain-containing protein n=1 Tax=Microbacterium sp. LRZ72 TaxID=2942481 RepID=UPI0029A16CD2|nr:ankyrin repeat domain-containing protein [Microbacterium sp. LRZ72]MDX2377679.1 ankyrin repeat domain-containing protein [Microbacterium sp. LRZ72]
MSDENPGAHLSAEVIEGTFDLAREGRTGPLGEMLDAGVPIDTRNARGDTLLIVATYAEQPETVAELLRRGADVDAVNGMGQTAVACAVFRKDPVVLRGLLEAGANPDLGSHTAAQIADQFGMPEMKAVLEEFSRG